MRRLGATLACLLAFAAPEAAAAVPAGWDELAGRIAAPWPALQDSKGHFRDYVVSRTGRAGRDDYGDAMLGYGLLLRAARAGGAPVLRDAGLAAIGNALRSNGDPANAPFRFVALAGAYNVARADFADAAGFRSIRSRWERTLKGFEPRRLGGAVSNKTVVEAVAVLELRRTGFLTGEARAMKLVRRLLATDLPRAARRFRRSSGRAGTTALIGDFTGAPLAYHALATGFLARAIDLMGPAAPRAAERLLRQAVSASWALAGPDGDVAYIGRSQEQSWTLALTAYASERAGGRLRALAGRTIGRLGDAYEIGANDGLFVTPALGQDVRSAIRGLDPYVAAASYNGLTLAALDWAIGAAGSSEPGGAIGADRNGSFRLARGPQSFTAVRQGDVWFAVKQAKSDPKDLRYDFGLIALKVRDDAGAWQTMPLRPRVEGTSATAGPVLAGRGLPVGRKLIARGGRVTVRGGFRTASGRWLRKGVAFRFAPTACGVRLTVPVERGDDLDYGAFAAPRQAVTADPLPRAKNRGSYASGLDARERRTDLRFRDVRAGNLEITTCLRGRGSRVAGRRVAGSVVADDLKPPLSAWDRSGAVKLRGRGGRYYRALELSGSGRITRPLPDALGAVSLDVKLPNGAALDVDLGGKRRTYAGPAGWRRIELAGDLDGPITLHARRGKPLVRALIATQRGDPGALLLHRLAAIHAQTSLKRHPYGATPSKLRFSGDWTTGFWPGALWRAYDLTGSRLFRDWALAATLAHRGHERDRTHDQGFRYLESSAAGYDRICDGRQGTTSCKRLRRSALEAADTLLRLQRTNPGAGTIPTLPSGCGDCVSDREGETIVDSMMNVGLVEWAYQRTHAARYRRAALKHARGVARLLVRENGSTTQAVRLDRRTGRVIKRHTHQGASNRSTWARGQAWAVYGFAQSGANLRDGQLVRTSERAATYVEQHLPESGVPPYDYSARRPVDVSAGVITAAGLFRLADACDAATCKQPPAHWRALAQRMLAASLKHANAVPPLGFLGDQVLTRGGDARWDDHAELIFGLDYALEGVNR